MESQVLVERLPARASRRSEAVEWGLPTGALLAAVLVLAWLLVAPNSPDLAAQAYRTRLFEEAGFVLWDNNWYAGHHLLGYSLIYPWLAALLGMRFVGAVAVLVSTWAFERVTLPVYGEAARWAAPCFALAASGDLWIGRLTFSLGVALALLAVLALTRGQRWCAAALAALCATGSPVAGLLLAFAGFTHVLCERRMQAGLVLAMPALAVVLPLQLLFPEGGWEPFAASSVFATLGATLALAWALPARERLLRRGAVLYAAVTLFSLIHAPMGANVERYGVLLAAPLLLCGLGRSGWSSARRPPVLVGVALCAVLSWTVWGPLRQAVQVLHDPSTSPSFYVPLRRFLAARRRGPIRIEVPFTRSHWDAALLAPYVPLARGWERQLDKRYNFSIEANPPSPAVYWEWLQRNAISYVALPGVPLDPSSRGEGALIRSGAPYLREVLHTAHWRVFEVLKPTPLASSPASLVKLSHDSFTLRFTQGGTSLVRIHYTPYWALAGGAGCAREAPEGWTAVSAAHAGVVRVAARFSFERALGLAGACS